MHQILDNFYQIKSHVIKRDQNMVWATFCAICSQAYLVTLVGGWKSKKVRNRCWHGCRQAQCIDAGSEITIEI
jgi:hypothetical protein